MFPVMRTGKEWKYKETIMKQTYSYDDEKTTKSKKCLICKAEVTEDEFSFEDYFVLFRGHSESCFEGFICFACIKDRREL